MKNYVILAFYKFVHLSDYVSLKPCLLEKMIEYNIKGTIILASEGINGSYCGTPNDVDRFTAYLKSYPEFVDLQFKINYDEANPFDKCKIKLRQEIVSLGIGNIDVENNTGIHVTPQEWNELILDESVLVIDNRNTYEIELGTYQRAINPRTINFRDFPQYVEEHLLTKKDKKIAMCCTGGIRCEKSTAYLKSLGFQEVYQLDGGILNYLETIPEEESLWQGDCFVFDNRVAVDKNLSGVEKGSIDLEWKNKNRQMHLNDGA